MRNRHVNCKASVIQRGPNYVRGLNNHLHQPETGLQQKVSMVMWQTTPMSRIIRRVRCMTREVPTQRLTGPDLQMYYYVSAHVWYTAVHVLARWYIH